MLFDTTIPEPSPGIDFNLAEMPAGRGGHDRFGVSVAKRAYEIAVRSG